MDRLRPQVVAIYFIMIRSRGSKDRFLAIVVLLLAFAPPLQVVHSKCLLPDRSEVPFALLKVGRGGGGGSIDEGDSLGSRTEINIRYGWSGKIPDLDREEIANEDVMTGETSHGYKLLQEDVLHNGWRRLIRRRVQYPHSEQVVDFEVVGQKGGTDQAVLVFCWDTQTKTATLVREYMPSVHRMMHGLAAGMVEHDRHSQSPLIAAQHELEEECHMTGGREWILLTPSSIGGIVMDKYSTTRISVYLVLDANPMNDDEKANRPRDESEEGMQILRGVTVEQIRCWMSEGEMTIVGSWACLLAFEKLRELGEIGH